MNTRHLAPHHVVRIGADSYYGAEPFPDYAAARKRALELSRQRKCVVVRNWVTGCRYSVRELIDAMNNSPRPDSPAAGHV